MESPTPVGGSGTRWPDTLRATGHAAHASPCRKNCAGHLHCWALSMPLGVAAGTGSQAPPSRARGHSWHPVAFLKNPCGQRQCTSSVTSFSGHGSSWNTFVTSTANGHGMHPPLTVRKKGCLHGHCASDESPAPLVKLKLWFAATSHPRRAHRAYARVGHTCSRPSSGQKCPDEHSAQSPTPACACTPWYPGLHTHTPPSRVESGGHSVLIVCAGRNSGGVALTYPRIV